MWVRTVVSVARKRDALAVHRRMLAGERAVETLLDDLVGDVARTTVEEPVPHQTLRVFRALAPTDRSPLGDIRIPKIHVLDALDRLKRELGSFQISRRVIEREHKSCFDACVLR